MIIGTAGHIDHGKTALVRALTGVDTDRLAAEKARGITIELGFAYADLGGGAVTGFVDVPGHERFVHTMLAGAGGIDLALLVVAANDGVMPQTREHLAILDLLLAMIGRDRDAEQAGTIAEELIVERLREGVGEAREPVLDDGEPGGVDAVHAPGALGPHGDQPGLAQDPQVLRRAGLAEPELGGELADQPRALPEQIQDGAAGRFGEHLERHPSNIPV